MKQQGNRRFLTASGLVFWGIMVLAVTCFQPGVSPAADRAPKLVLSADRFDFGQVFEDRKLTHTFQLQNTGDAPLKILKVDPDCACTVPEYDQTIPPGRDGSITLSLKPYSVLHQFRKETKIWTNDPERSEFSLVLTGKARPFIEIQPSHIVRLRGAQGDNLQGRVTFVSHLPGPFQIKNFRTNIPDKIEVNLKAVQPDREYVLEVKNKARTPGPYAGLIELYTTSKERPRLIVRVFGDINLPSAMGQ